MQQFTGLQVCSISGKTHLLQVFYVPFYRKLRIVFNSGIILRVRIAAIKQESQYGCYACAVVHCFVSDTILPSTNVTTLHALSMTRWSWVEKIKVILSSLFSFAMISSRFSADFESRFAVGSS